MRWTQKSFYTEAFFKYYPKISFWFKIKEIINLIRDSIWKKCYIITIKRSIILTEENRLEQTQNQSS